MPISISEIADKLKEKINSIKIVIARLKQDNIILVTESKRGFYSCYEVHEKVKQYFLAKEKTLKNKIPNGTSNGTTNGTIKGTTKGTDAYVVSSSYINTTTTNLSEDFRQIDFCCLADFGFNESHLIQIYREHSKKPEISLSAEIIQNSIYSLAFDLKHNNVAETFKQSPVVILTALLKKGQPYSSKTPEKVLTPQEEAMQEYLLAQEKRQQKINDIKTKVKEATLQGWLESLSAEELLNFNQEPRPEGMPDRVYQTSRRKKALEFAKDYFSTVLWPEKFKQILNNIEEANKPQEQT